MKLSYLAVLPAGASTVVWRRKRVTSLDSTSTPSPTTTMPAYRGRRVNGASREPASPC